MPNRPTLIAMLALSLAPGCKSSPDQVPAAAVPSAPAEPPPVTPKVIDAAAVCPRCVAIFDGKSFDGWVANPAVWTIVQGAMRGEGKGSRAAYTKADYSRFRLIVTSRMAPKNKDHLGILFWGARPPAEGEYKQNLQFQSPHGAMWDYFENKAVQAEKVGPVSRDYESWHTTEILADLASGSFRAAVSGIEVRRYKDANPGRLSKGPIAMQRHGNGASEYRDIYIEVDPTEERLLTVP